MSSMRSSTSNEIGLRLTQPSPAADPFDGWPQRLLHIPSMKSLTRQPGNWYGCHHDPEYSALSYTWGRFKLASVENLDVKAIEITGVDWTIPRIRPNHFTVDNFQQIINRIQELGTKFLWLDVACIDQREKSRDGQLEVGRQAAIFQRAKKTYIWLTTIAIGDCEVLLDVASNSIYVDHMNFIERILKDPWFKSIWTLQEAHLCIEKSSILGGVGTEMLTISSFGISFEAITRACLWLRGILRGPANVVGIEDKAEAWIQILNRSGVFAIASRNPLLLYNATQYRDATDPLDYIYGFQQVFSLQLGNTAPDAAEGKSYTLRELEDQFGDFLLKRYPAESQMHIFSSAQDGKGWHMNRFSRIPTFENQWNSFQAIFSMQNPQEPLCELESRLTGSQVMGHFSGHLCFAHDFLEAINKDDAVELFAALDCQKPSDNIGSDLSQLLKLMRSAHRDRVYIRPDSSTSRSDLSQLERELEKIRKLGTKVLKLGKLSDKLQDSTSVFRTRDNRGSYECETVISGLILEKEKLGHWRRLGICLWKIAGPIEDIKDFGEIKWTAEEGYFG